MKVIFCASLLCCLSFAAAGSVNLEFPGRSTSTFSEEKVFNSYDLPIGPFADGAVQTLVAEGAFLRKAWRVISPGIGTVRLTDALRQQVEAQGFELLFECEADRCGGFDFRVNILVVPQPDMHVDLGDFRFFSAQRLGGSTPEYISVLVSRSGDISFVQLIRVGGVTSNSVQVGQSGDDTATLRPPLQQSSVPIVDRLIQTGSAALDDLDFATGSSNLEKGSFASLDAIAAYLREQPEARLVLVGHTDAVGSQKANIALSRRRAQSVMRRLIDEYLVPRSQVSADGVGFLAPRASNQTEEGRAANRRVEAVLDQPG